MLFITFIVNCISCFTCVTASEYCLPGLYSVSWIAITVLERGFSATGLLTQKGPDSMITTLPGLHFLFSYVYNIK